MNQTTHPPIGLKAKTIRAAACSAASLASRAIQGLNQAQKAFKDRSRLAFVALVLLPGLALLGATAPVAQAADLLVSSNGSNQVLRYDGATGAFVEIFADGDLSGTNLGRPQGLVYGPDGNLYVSSALSQEVRRYDGTTGAFIDAFVTASSGGLFGPRDLTFGPDGNLYVVSGLTDQILRYNGTTGAFIDVFVTASDSSMDFVALVFGPDGNLYVSDYQSVYVDQVLLYQGPSGTNPGELIEPFVNDGSTDLNGPSGLAFGPDGNLYVSSYQTSQVRRYRGPNNGGPAGEFIDAFVAQGSGGLNGPNGLVFGPDGNLYVADSVDGQSNRVMRYNGTTGTFIDIFVTEGSGGLESPLFLTFMPDAPDTGCTYDLIADGGSEATAVVVGSVSTLKNTDDGTWTVTYTTTGDWYITEAHLDAVCDPDDFPMTRKGNPQVGQFLYHYYGDSQDVPFTVPDPGCDVAYFAAHAGVVDKSDCWDSDGDTIADTCRKETGWAEEYLFPGKSWATYVDSACGQ